MTEAFTVLRQHWPEYLMEAWGLGMFLISAGIFATLLEYTGSPVHQAIADPTLRRVLMGLAMGLTAIGIIYSPWGQTSGAHINPAVTLTFLRLGKVAKWDALFYIVAQFVGGTLGIMLVALVLREAFTDPPVVYVTTRPGAYGKWVAMAIEFIMAMILMLTILWVSNSKHIARLTGIAAGMLVATFIILAGPLSGMSINPARTFASAAPSKMWTDAWIYFIAPVLGMLTAVEIYTRLRLMPEVKCAKLDHPDYRRCIHCGYTPDADKQHHARHDHCEAHEPATPT